MKKKQPRKRPSAKNNEELTLKDTLQSDVFQALKDKKKELEKEETTRKEEEAEKKRQEARQREKNKSFEELLGESSMNWKDYK
ncbi:YqkE family protein [Rossellomorea vietnamensis]|uniref:YqkE family protein n=1 Tax=Rossellomorea vietnamensis TaxID=218284 RepID=UPI003CF449FF